MIYLSIFVINIVIVIAKQDEAEIYEDETEISVNPPRRLFRPFLTEKDMLQDIPYYFKEFGIFYNHQFNTFAERDKALLEFSKNLKKLVKLSQRRTTAEFKLNKYAIYSLDKFNSLYTGFNDEDLDDQDVYDYNIEIIDIPNTLDYRGILVPDLAFDQGECRSSYVFSAVQNIEAQVMKNFHFYPNLSLQYAYECEPTGDCVDGGLPHLVMETIMEKKGIVETFSYPNYYDSKKSKRCKVREHLATVKVTGAYRFRVQDEELLKHALSLYGPLSIALNVGEEIKHYHSGVLKPQNCHGKLNHAVLLCGYGSNEDGTPFWLIKNSWGPGWGEQGYLRLVRGEWACGIGSYIATATVDITYEHNETVTPIMLPVKQKPRRVTLPMQETEEFFSKEDLSQTVTEHTKEDITTLENNNLFAKRDAKVTIQELDKLETFKTKCTTLITTFNTYSPIMELEVPTNSTKPIETRRVQKKKLTLRNSTSTKLDITTEYGNLDLKSNEKDIKRSSIHFRTGDSYEVAKEDENTSESEKLNEDGNNSENRKHFIEEDLSVPVFKHSDNSREESQVFRNSEAKMRNRNLDEESIVETRPTFKKKAKNPLIKKKHTNKIYGTTTVVTSYETIIANSSQEIVTVQNQKQVRIMRVSTYKQVKTRKQTPRKTYTRPVRLTGSPKRKKKITVKTTASNDDMYAIDPASDIAVSMEYNSKAESDKTFTSKPQKHRSAKVKTKSAIKIKPITPEEKNVIEDQDKEDVHMNRHNKVKNDIKSMKKIGRSNIIKKTSKIKRGITSKTKTRTTKSRATAMNNIDFEKEENEVQENENLYSSKNKNKKKKSKVTKQIEYEEEINTEPDYEQDDETTVKIIKHKKTQRHKSKSPTLLRSGKHRKVKKVKYTTAMVESENDDNENSVASENSNENDQSNNYRTTQLMENAESSSVKEIADSESDFVTRQSPRKKKKHWNSYERPAPQFVFEDQDAKLSEFARWGLIQPADTTGKQKRKPKKSKLYYPVMKLVDNVNDTDNINETDSDSIY